MILGRLWEHDDIEYGLILIDTGEREIETHVLSPTTPDSLCQAHDARVTFDAGPDYAFDVLLYGFAKL